MTTYSPDLYVAALRFAAEAHAGQKEPGSELPYLVHVVSVAAELIAVLPPASSPGHDLAVQCALLHDTVEDTGTPLSAIEAQFGAEVARGVDALSKRADLPKAEQMADSLARILTCPPEIAWVKLADRATNLSAPPHYWSPEKCAAYRVEAERIVSALGHTNEALTRRLQERIASYRQYERA